MKLSQWRLLHACTLSTSYSYLKRYYNSYRANQSAPHAKTARKRNNTVRILLKLKDQGTLFFVFSCHSKCFCYYIDFEIKNEVSFIICLLSFISILQLWSLIQSCDPLMMSEDPLCLTRFNSLLRIHAATQ